MFMKVIIHCGRSKTGTSSLQESLRRSSKHLQESGILYYTGGFANHNPLAMLAGKKGRQSAGQSEAYTEQAQQLAADIRDMAESRRFSHLLVSAEYMENFSADQFSGLMDILHVRPESVAVIMYIRSPHSMYLSRMQQKIKADHLLLPPRAYRDDTLECIDNWTATVGYDNLTVRLFSPESLDGGDIVTDFAYWANRRFALGINGLPGVRMNPSLSAESAVTLQQYRGICCAEYPRVFLHSSNHLINALAAVEQESGYSFTKARLRGEVVSAIYRNNADVVEAVESRYPALGFSRHCLAGLGSVPGQAADKASAVDSENFADIVADLNPQTLQALPFLALDRAIADYLAMKSKNSASSDLRAQVKVLRARIAALKQENQKAPGAAGAGRRHSLMHRIRGIFRCLAGKIRKA